MKADGWSLFSTLVNLWPYIWPSDRADLKARVLFATALIFIAKLATIAVPFTFKWATDALAGHGTAPIGPNDWLAWALAERRVMMTLAYGGMRILMGVLTQWRDGIFAKVAMNAVRRLAFLTFEHMHLLSLRFHLERKTGGLTRAARARPQRHREHRAHVAAAADADHRRGGAGRLGRCCPLRLALSDRGPADDRALCRLHLPCHRMAHQHPLDERSRHRR